MSIDAMQIWSELADECGQAKRYYDRKGINKDLILERGAADFDQKCFPDNKHEQKHYRADYYVSRDGYMNMHIEQNLAVLRHCFEDEISQPMLFIDFGCGPMTSGLALAEVLSGKAAGYKRETAYFGVDVSQNMVDKAKSINKKYRLFSPGRFGVVRGTQFDAWNIPDSFPAPHIVVLCLSFVLAPDTLKFQEDNDFIQNFSNYFKRYIERQPGCREARIVYLNPKSKSSYYLHDNWRIFANSMLTSDFTSRFRYTSDGFTRLPVEILGRADTVSTQIIRGTSK
ncbi:MAG: class I SAM-dependent methyltransferase [Gammaproteobacteria bacterium]|nr:class I SAM-dependent methyltransferase [Gammaproteobacteria bacterium]